METQNTIQSGLNRLKKELNEQAKKEELTKLLKASIVFESYGIQNRMFSSNFRKWIAITKTDRDQLEEIVKNAHFQYSKELDGPNVGFIEYDQEVLELHINDTIIYFESLYFEDYVGAQEYAFDDGSDYLNGHGKETILSAREYLQEHWQERAEDFILNNLTRAEIEDSDIEELLNPAE